MATLHLFRHLIDNLHDWGKVCWATQGDAFDGVFVSFGDAIDAVDLRVKDVAIEGKTVTGALALAEDSCTVTKHWYLLVAVIVLKNTPHRFNCV